MIFSRHIFLPAFLIFFVLAGAAFSQSNFVLSPVKTLIGQASVNNYDYYEIEVINQTSGDLELGWDKLQDSMVPGWDYSMCDFGNCYASIPNSGIMSPIQSGSAGFFKITLNPYTYEGTGIIRLLVYEISNPSVKDTASFILTLGPTGVGEMLQAQDVTVFPTLAQSVLHVRSKGTSSAFSTFEIYSATGALHYRANASGISSDIDVSNLPADMYVLRIISADGTMITRRFVKTG